MRLLNGCRAGLVVLSCIAVTHGHAAVVYDESTMTDLSNSGSAPTSIPVALGSNEIDGATGFVGSGVDPDYFHITVPVGLQLAHINLLPGTTIGGGVSFLGVEAGNKVTVGTSPSDATGLLGWIHYDGQDVGKDILPAMGTSDFNATGFTPPLPHGEYAFWLQDTESGDNGPVLYKVDLVLTAVPEPDAVALMLAGLAIVATAASRRVRR